MQENIITPKERLMIAVQIAAGMQAPGYKPTLKQRQEMVAEARMITNELIVEMGCMVQVKKPTPVAHEMD